MLPMLPGIKSFTPAFSDTLTKVATMSFLLLADAPKVREIQVGKYTTSAAAGVLPGLKYCAISAAGWSWLDHRGTAGTTFFTVWVRDRKVWLPNRLLTPVPAC